MKKFIFILTILIGALGANAQLSTGDLNCKSNGTYVKTPIKTKDTVTTGTDTGYLAMENGSFTKGTIQVVAVRINGTCVVTGYLEHSNDNSRWFQASLADTINLKPAANAVVCKAFIVTSCLYKYTRIRFVSHDAGDVQLNAIYYYRKD